MFSRPTIKHLPEGNIDAEIALMITDERLRRAWAILMGLTVMAITRTYHGDFTIAFVDLQASAAESLRYFQCCARHHIQTRQALLRCSSRM